MIELLLSTNYKNAYSIAVLMLVVMIVLKIMKLALKSDFAEWEKFIKIFTIIWFLLINYLLLFRLDFVLLEIIKNEGKELCIEIFLVLMVLNFFLNYMDWY
jgi:peptidoglycan/LPS O-acetylase OafA/YrhL